MEVIPLCAHPRPTAKARAERQRYRLRMAAQAVPSQRRRLPDDHGRVVLVALLSKLAPVSLTGGWLQSHTGLSAAEVGAALRVLEADGAMAPGSLASGRADFLTPAVMDVLGVSDLALPWDVDPDVPPSGTAVEATDAELTEAFASQEVAA